MAICMSATEAEARRRQDEMDRVNKTREAAELLSAKEDGKKSVHIFLPCLSNILVGICSATLIVLLNQREMQSGVTFTLMFLTIECKIENNSIMLENSSFTERE